MPIPGNATFANGTFTVTGSGADVWGTADAFHYAYTPLTGDGTIVARVASIQDVNAWVKAGVMIRESLGRGAAQAFMLVVAPSKGLAFQRRPRDRRRQREHRRQRCRPRRAGSSCSAPATSSAPTSRRTA